MANFWYTRAARDLGRGTLNLHTGGDDIRARICMTNTTCDTEQDTTFLDQFTTIDVSDGSGYVEGVLDNEVFNEDQPANQGQFDADDETWTALGVGTRAIAGVLIYKFVTNDAASIPIIWIDTPAPPNSNGGNWTIQFHLDGIGTLDA